VGTDFSALNPFVYMRPLTPSEAIQRPDADGHLLALAEGGHNATLSAPRRYVVSGRAGGDVIVYDTERPQRFPRLGRVNWAAASRTAGADRRCDRYGACQASVGPRDSVGAILVGCHNNRLPPRPSSVLARALRSSPA
jgi:hypothetical protein